MRPDNIIQYRANASLLGAIETRASSRNDRNRVASLAAERYFALVIALLDNNVTFTEAEAMLLCASHRQRTIAPDLMWYIVYKSICAGDTSTEGVPFVERLRNLPLTTAIAVADAVERANLQLDIRQAIHDVGLVR